MKRVMGHLLNIVIIICMEAKNKTKKQTKQKNRQKKNKTKQKQKKIKKQNKKQTNKQKTAHEVPVVKKKHMRQIHFTRDPIE